LSRWHTALKTTQKSWHAAAKRTRRASIARGDKGRDVVREEGVPAHLQALVDEKRAELIERLADVDDEVGSGTVGVLWCEGEVAF
jgi:hypothetical protein